MKFKFIGILVGIAAIIFINYQAFYGIPFSRVWHYIMALTIVTAFTTAITILFIKQFIANKKNNSRI